MQASGLDACYRYLGFDRAPFQITPDTAFFFPHSQYLDAISHLKFGLVSGGFTLLTGEVGLGKTLLCHYLLRNLPEGVRIAHVFNPQQSYPDLLASIFHGLTGEVPAQDSVAKLHDQLYRVLFDLAAQGQRVAVVIDEAHRLTPELFEGLRLLSNLETEERKLISLLIIGQTELERSLAFAGMRALKSRISVWYRLRPFNRRETAEYIAHRLRSARAYGDFRFSGPALWLAHRYSEGVPRRINQICDRALLAAFGCGRQGVGIDLLRRSAREVLGL